jgi:hypothetical protein
MDELLVQRQSVRIIDNEKVDQKIHTVQLICSWSDLNFYNKDGLCPTIFAQFEYLGFIYLLFKDSC